MRVAETIARSRLAEQFQPGDYALIARAGDYVHVYKARVGELVDLTRRRIDLTREVAAALDLPTSRYGIAAARQTMIYYGLPAAVPQLGAIGFCDIAVHLLEYTLPDERGSPVHYRIWKDGRLERLLKTAM